MTRACGPKTARLPSGRGSIGPYDGAGDPPTTDTHLHDGLGDAPGTGARSYDGEVNR
jgi:hypothetical protein